jgi:hypothetical protein
MKAFRFKYTEFIRWKQRGVEHLRGAMRHLQRLLAVDRPPEALALVPIRSVQRHVTRQRSRRPWVD